MTVEQVGAPIAEQNAVLGGYDKVLCVAQRTSGDDDGGLCALRGDSGCARPSERLDTIIGGEHQMPLVRVSTAQGPLGVSILAPAEKQTT